MALAKGIRAQQSRFAALSIDSDSGSDGEEEKWHEVLGTRKKEKTSQQQQQQQNEKRPMSKSAKKRARKKRNQSASSEVGCPDHCRQIVSNCMCMLFTLCDLVLQATPFLERGRIWLRYNHRVVTEEHNK